MQNEQNTLTQMQLYMCFICVSYERLMRTDIEKRILLEVGDTSETLVENVV